MRYICPSCGSGGGGRDDTGYLCHNCPSGVVMLPADNNTILDKHNMVVRLHQEFICTESNLLFAATYWGKQKQANLNIKIHFTLK